jgi:uncharacterized protein
MLNYAVDPALLRGFVPPGVVLDDFQGTHYVSLVGFLFLNTRLIRVPVPFHQRFEEINLRFYVRRQDRRGVVFIREIVPKRAVAAIARLAFGENYVRYSMSHRITGDPPTIEYAWHSGGERNVLRAEAAGESALAREGSVEQFITEHYWGYSRQADGECLEYEVQHPRWRVWQTTNASFEGNAAPLYGDKLAEVVARSPESAFIADGSEVTVFRGRRIATRRENWRRVLRAEVARWSAKSCEELVAELTDSQIYEVADEAGTYQVEVEMLENTAAYVHVIVAIDDGSLPASIAPVSESFLVNKR